MGWSDKYKKSIDCNNPKGFSQKAHCAGRKKRENKMSSKLEELVGKRITEEQFDEAAGKKDACYHKVKARYDVWPSAYASGALVKCRKVGAANWGEKSKKKEGFASDAQRRAAFASGYKEKGKKKKKESVAEATYKFKGFTNSKMDELDAMLSRAGIQGTPDFNKMTYTTSGRQSPAVINRIMKKLGGKKIEEAYDIWAEDGSFGYTMTGIVEAEYQGRKVKLNKPMQGDVKKFKVYVKNPKGNVVKVNFGQGGDAKGGTMRIRKSNPKARASFRARHNCDTPGPKHKARYWSCKKW
tara:strand:+ start:8788 stop:9678 length:891 start_codon:yes stop_codon:yes gene_type:complete